jgi:hypothetical protein
MIPINNKPTINEIFLFILIYGFFFLQIKEYIFTENFYISAITICVYLFIILVIEILIIATIFKINFFQKFVLSKKIIFFLFIFINYYCVILSNSFDFTMIHYKSKLIEITKHASIGVIVTYIFFLNIDTVKRVSVLFIIINTLYIFNIDSLFSQKNENILRDSIGQKYLFKKKPNIYVFSFETLPPLSITKKHLGIESNYFQKNIEHKIHLLKNNFADNVPTSNSLNSFLFLDQQKFRKLDEKTAGSFFAGRNLSTVFKILKDNNYKLITGFHDSTFGAPGKYVDSHLNFRSVKNESNAKTQIYPQYCQFKLPWYHFQLFMYCNVLNKFLNINDNLRLKSGEDFHQYLLTLINKKDNQPKFAFFHIYKTIHPTEGINDFSKFFKNELENVFIYMNKVIENVTNKDPGSLLILTGDHSHLILKWSKNQNLKNSVINQYTDEEKAIILDTYPAFGAIYDHSSICKKNTNVLISKKYSTNSMIMNHILGCLNGDKNMLFKDLKYNLPNEKSYLNYIYE